MVTIKPATQKEVEMFYGELPGYSMKGVVALDGDEPVGVGGTIRYEGKTFLFCEIKDKARKYKKYIIKAARMLMQENDNRTLYAVAQEDVPNSDKFLEYLGFELVDTTRRLYRRSAHG